MRPAPFQLERYFARHEFSAPYLLCASDGEPLTLAELLAWADEECLHLWHSLSLGYTESAGHPRLRQAIAALYEHAAAEDVLVVAPEEGILIVMLALLSAGDHVVTTFPAYQSLYALAESLGCRVERWLPRMAQGHWRFDVDDLAALLRDDTRLVVINFPHNPTGALIRREELDEILALARARASAVFSDEMYRLLEHDPAARLPAACDLDQGAVSLAGLSKAYALPGLRIGWLVTRDQDLYRSLAELKDYTTICSSAPSEILALMALRAGERVLGRLRAILGDNLAALGAFGSRWSHRLEWLPPEGGTVAFPRLVDATPAARFCEELLASQGVLLLPGEVYAYPGNHLRLGYGRRNLP
ncbi:MAG: aminotransferase class I/II-fold pyridoxal phosphate-dependent enzyme, partial [Anaerolineae bacterium]|nr:aminotransferase class I/II-fold pyridoxal phosphate-dependent enzyme [Anaerolineae bacterium]